MLLTTTLSNVLFAKDIGSDDYKLAVKDFAGIAGTWYLNKKCNILSNDQGKEFEWHVGKINIALRKVVGFYALKAIQIKAQEESKKPELTACGQNTSNLVKKAFARSKALSYNLTNEQYSKGNSLKSTLQQKYRVAYIAYTIEKKCSHLPNTIRPEVILAFRSIRDKLIKKKSQNFIDLIEKPLSQNTILKKAKACSQHSHLYVHTGLSAIRELRDEVL